MHDEKYNKMDSWIVARVKFWWPVLSFVVAIVASVVFIYVTTDIRITTLEAWAQENKVSDMDQELNGRVIKLETIIPEINNRLDRIEKKIDDLIKVVK